MTRTTSGAPPGKQNGRPDSGRPKAAPSSIINAPSVQRVNDFKQGYQLGFAAGVVVGEKRLEHELAEQDRRRMEYMHGLSNSPAYAALERIRWDGARKDFGRPRPTDHPGGPVPWERE